jgi:hypothetical protein
MHVKKLYADLAMAGQALKHDEIITYLLAYLEPEYDSFVTMIYVKENIS